MKQISRKDWENYIKALSGLSQKAAQIMQAFAEQNGLEDRDALIRMQYALATKYGEAAASLACQMYDAVAEASGAMVPPAEPAETATYKEAAIAVNGSLKQSPSGKVLPQTTDRLVKQAAADTTLKNALRDGAQFAWVPNGDTCAFCLTLASRGWQYASKKTIQGGHADHIHANCDCTFAIRFDNSTTVAGYDPDKYKRIYSKAEGNTPHERINALRRMLNAENREENHIINIMDFSLDTKYIDKSIFRNVRFKTGGLSPKEYALSKAQKTIEKYDNHGIIKLPKDQFIRTDFSEIQHLEGRLSNYDVRLWYAAHVDDIKNHLNPSDSLEKQARIAFELRNQYRTEARRLMEDSSTAKRLNKNKKNRTFEQLVEKANSNGLYGDDAYKDIIRSSMHHNEAYDKKAGI